MPQSSPKNGIRTDTMVIMKFYNTTISQDSRNDYLSESGLTQLTKSLLQNLTLKPYE